MFPKVAKPVVPAEVFLVRASVHPARARETVERELREGFLRPADIAGADIDPPALLFVPFWRVAVTVDGFHVGLSAIPGRTGRPIPLPTGGARHKDADIMICARTVVPYEPRLPSFFGKVCGTAAPIEVGMSELVPAMGAGQTLEEGVVVDADVERAQAERIASQILVRATQPSHAIYSRYIAEVRSATLPLPAVPHPLPLPGRGQPRPRGRVLRDRLRPHGHGRGRQAPVERARRRRQGAAAVHVQAGLIELVRWH